MYLFIMIKLYYKLKISTIKLFYDLYKIILYLAISWSKPPIGSAYGSVPAPHNVLSYSRTFYPPILFLVLYNSLYLHILKDNFYNSSLIYSKINRN